MWIKGTEIEKLIIEDYKSGMLINDIADKYEIASGTVSLCAKRAGINCRSKNRSVKNKDEIEQMYSVDGVMIPEIAKRLGIEERQVINYIKYKRLRRPVGYVKPMPKRGAAALPKQKTVSHPKNSNLVRTGSAENYHRKSREGEQKPGTVFCDSACMKKCYYSNGGTCDYILIEGHSRGCHWSECTKFVDKVGGLQRQQQSPTNE